MIYIIGSGPAGIAAAKIIVEKGHAVTLIDGGIEIDPKIESKVKKLKSLQKSDWDPEIINSFKDQVSADPKGMQKKLIYGSDFPYQSPEGITPIENITTGNFCPSFAKGGFSNVWGSAVLPYTTKDTAKWPIKISDLEQYYKSVLSFMPLTWANDEFKDLFKPYTEIQNILHPSRQAANLLNNLNKNKQVFKNQNIHFSPARLAVRSGTDNNPECVYCGLCLFGCPRQIIYSTADTLESLLARENFNYLPNTLVTKLSESDGKIQIEGFNRLNKEKIKLNGSKCFLAAGVISSTQILLNSKQLFNTKLKLAASEYFISPAFSLKSFKEIEIENLHSLAQVFLEIINQDICDDYIHLQIYTYSELYKIALNKMLRLIPFNSIIKRQVLNRMMAIQGYIHSDHSSHIEAIHDGGKLILTGIKNPVADSIIRKAIKKLNSLRKYSDLFIMRQMLQIGLPGEGRHVGGSFPMSLNPGELETDLLGRPFQWQNIHVVDSSIFPSVPAPTITFTVMANAQRIANLSL